MHRKLITMVSAGAAALAVTAGSVAMDVPAASASTAVVASAHTNHSLTAAKVRTWLRAHRRAITRVVVDTTAQTIGITPSELVAALKSGQTIAEVAQAHGVQASAVADALTAKGDARIATLESKGKITATRAARLRLWLENRTSALLVHHFG